MTDTKNHQNDDFDPAARRDELVQRFASLAREDALRQIAVLPFYHQVEHEITKPNQGVYVTRYFLTKWQAALGSEASSIVLALRLLADKDGRTFASLETIAQYAGMSARSLRRWLSQSEDAIQPCSPERVEQWRFLHRYFLRSKSNRYLIRKEGGLSRARRTTNLYEVAMDDPVHPSDEPKLFALAAERMVQQEASERAKTLQNKGDSYKGQIGRNKPGKVVIFESDKPPAGETQPYSGQTGLHEVGPNWPGVSSSYRTINVPNVNLSGKKADRTEPSLFAQDPRVASLGAAERRHLDALVDELGDFLHRKEGSRDDDAHRSAGAHRRLVYFLGENLVRRAMRLLEDRIEDGRAGRREAVRKPSAAFYGIARNLAAEAGVSLEPEGQGPAGKNEALTAPLAATTAPAPPRRAILEQEEQGTPEARAEIYAQHLFPFQHRLQFDRDPTEDEKRAAYDRRLAELQAPKS